MSNEGYILDTSIDNGNKMRMSAAVHRSIEAEIISHVLQYHLSTGGSCDTVLDVGCVSGESTRLLATRFKAALGIDESAKNVHRSWKLSVMFEPSDIARGRVKFAKGNEKDLSQVTQHISSNGKVDLVVVCGKAHSFDSSAFWSSSAQVLNPGGTAVLMTASTICHPSTPNRLRVQQILSHIEREYLPTYKVGGMGCDRHETFQHVPSTSWRPGTEVDGITEKKLEWDTDAVASPRFFWYWSGHTTATQLEAWLATSPPYHDWRETNPHLRDTSEDLVTKTIREMTEALCGERLVIGCMIHSVAVKNWA